ncbi:MAG: hypothetical protein ACRDY5_10715, partial [Acidimicrobiales bacterium]
APVPAPVPAAAAPDSQARPGGPVFWAGAVVGWGIIAAGLVGLFAESARTRPPDAARFVLGAALVHDLLVAPLVIALGLLVNRLAPRRSRPVVQGALIVSGAVALFSVPFVRGYGRQPTNPSVLPGNYAAGLATVLALVWGAAALLLVMRLRRVRTGAHVNRRSPAERSTRWPGQ